MFEVSVYLCGVYRCTTVAVHVNMYVQCGSHICSVICVKYVHSAYCHTLLQCGTYMCIHPPCKFIKHMAYMPSLFLAYVWQ